MLPSRTPPCFGNRGSSNPLAPSSDSEETTAPGARRIGVRFTLETDDSSEEMQETPWQRRVRLRASTATSTAQASSATQSGEAGSASTSLQVPVPLRLQSWAQSQPRHSQKGRLLAQLPRLQKKPPQVRTPRGLSCSSQKTTFRVYSDTEVRRASRAQSSGPSRTSSGSVGRAGQKDSPSPTGREEESVWCTMQVMTWCLNCASSAKARKCASLGPLANSLHRSDGRSTPGSVCSTRMQTIPLPTCSMWTVRKRACRRLRFSPHVEHTGRLNLCVAQDVAYYGCGPAVFP